MKITWSKNLFSCTYKLFESGKPIGYLINRTFSNTYEATILGEKYTFLSQGFFKQNTKIIDREKNTVVGKIVYNTWMNGATITIDDNKFLWKFDNIWNTKWSLVNKQGERIIFQGSSGHGKIISELENPLYLMCGLYVTNYNWQTASIAIAAMIPIWITLFS
ncbi:hypothetical protein GM418_00775 [Maribellus comscasis]|uniref:Uncharacterized protein n=1 Tax=Maribellus comscasis TaxID=2681766 RepID=A0A6I6JMF7_9BACT|nr:hypothetical protein [Maribellus comscasis]QGY42238.1 hypothetical protein GM418_00775 [Maribellus comscasis]